MRSTIPILDTVDFLPRWIAIVLAEDFARLDSLDSFLSALPLGTTVVAYQTEVTSRVREHGLHLMDPGRPLDAAAIRRADRLVIFSGGSLRTIQAVLDLTRGTSKAVDISMPAQEIGRGR